MLFSEFSRDSTKKNALFFVFAARKFANTGISSYLCSVKMNVLAIQVSFLRGQAVYVTTQFLNKPHPLGCGFAILSDLLFPEAVHHHLQESFTGSNITLDGNLLATCED